MPKSLATLAVLCCLMAACGSASDSTSVASGDEDGPTSFEDIEYRSPIAEYLGIDFGANEDAQAQWAEVEREAQRLTAQCMIDQGFEYIPVDNSSITVFGPGGEEIPYGSDEWVDKYGFGITTQRFPQSGVGDLVGYDDEGFDGPAEEFVDPNQEYIESLSESERDAYYAALYGVEPEFGPEGPDEDFAYEPSGCSNIAYEQASSAIVGDSDAFYEAFQDELDGLYERVEADPRLVEFNDSLTACMSDKGLEWVDMQELYERFEPRLAAIQPAAYSDEDPFEAAGLDPEKMSEAELDDFFRELNRVPAEKLPLLAELQAEEIELAKAASACGGSQLDFENLRNEIRIDLEQGFLDANADAIAEFKSSE